MTRQPRIEIPTALSERLAAALTRAERELTGRVAAVLAVEGRTIPEMRALAVLADGAGHPMTELAKSVSLPSPTVTRLVDRMVADGLVHRKVDETDRRRVRVHATPAGRRLQRRLAQLLDTLDRDILAEADAARLLELLAAIEAHPALRPSAELDPLP
ncbi:MAG: MarR family transcriptional regulator [Solirubrobacterales bacterium]|nr:MarR family transcriptional regulator [Solirubrobacterales bacterium]